MRESESPSMIDEVSRDNVDSALDDFTNTEDCGSGVVTVVAGVNDLVNQAIVDLTNEAVLCGWEGINAGEEDEVTQITDMKAIIGEDIFGRRGSNEVMEDFRLDLIGEDD